MYANKLGEFVFNQNQPDWVNTIQFVERRPVAVKGAMNPWETERLRLLWVAEKEAWVKIQPIKVKYRKVEQSLRAHANEFNGILKEVERITGKSSGMSPITTYGPMALAVIPGFGWAAAAFTIIFQFMGLFSGKKKRVQQLIGEMEVLQATMEREKRALEQLQREAFALIQTTSNVKAEQQAVIDKATERNIVEQSIRKQDLDRMLAYDRGIRSEIRRLHPVKRTGEASL